jgi:hypothetical protein
MEVTIKGAGEVVIRLIDAKGKTMMEQTMVASGSPTVEAKASVALELETDHGTVAVAPVLARCSNPRATIAFDGKAPADFTVARCRDIGGSAKLARQAAKGEAEALAPPRLTLPAPPKRRYRRGE